MTGEVVYTLEGHALRQQIGDRHYLERVRRRERHLRPAYLIQPPNCMLDIAPRIVSDKGDCRIQNLQAINGSNSAMPDESSKETAAAYHEAGHAVGAFFLGVPFGEIALDLADSGQGLVHSPLTIKQIRESNLCWQYAVVLMLGREAERLVFGRADRSYLQEDARNIAGLYPAIPAESIL